MNVGDLWQCENGHVPNEFYYTRINLPGDIMYEYKFECTNWKCLYSEPVCVWNIMHACT